MRTPTLKEQFVLGLLFYGWLLALLLLEDAVVRAVTP